MKADEAKFNQDIQKLLDQHKASMEAHLFNLKVMMGTKEIPIYTRWQELKAVIRAFEALAVISYKTEMLLYRIHKTN